MLTEEGICQFVSKTIPLINQPVYEIVDSTLQGKPPIHRSTTVLN